ncbi:hypothetical protein DXB96_14685 [Clostridium sp. OM07-10AC]|nr:hypothetical protein DXC08_14490 [Clostridium sp. OM07-9AC]RHV00060.1 hypothetical protein DXB96_14685 [Clostridium sp. OM07-10AC]
MRYFENKNSYTDVYESDRKAGCVNEKIIRKRTVYFDHADFGRDDLVMDYYEKRHCWEHYILERFGKCIFI